MTKFFKKDGIYEISNGEDYKLVFKCVRISKRTINSITGIEFEDVEQAGFNTCFTRYDIKFELVDVKINKWHEILNVFFKEWYDFGNYNCLDTSYDFDLGQYVNICTMFNIFAKEVK